MKITLLLTLSLFMNAFASTEFDHNYELWTKILQEHTRKSGQQVLVDYKAIKKNSGALKQYLSQLEKVSAKDFKAFSKQQKLAFWINVYNAYTVKLVIDHYPVSSIRKINAGLFKGGPWKKEFIELMGKTYSLDNVEHDIIRKDFSEPRIHFAVNCASMGCPSLYQSAFTAKDLDKELAQATQNFLSNKDKNYVKGSTLYVSKIFDWYGDDFKKKHGSFEKFIVQTLGLEKKDYTVKHLDYSWKLNDK